MSFPSLSYHDGSGHRVVDVNDISNDNILNGNVLTVADYSYASKIKSQRKTYR